MIALLEIRAAGGLVVSMGAAATKNVRRPGRGTPVAVTRSAIPSEQTRDAIAEAPDCRASLPCPRPARSQGYPAPRIAPRWRGTDSGGSAPLRFRGTPPRESLRDGGGRTVGVRHLRVSGVPRPADHSAVAGDGQWGLVATPKSSFVSVTAARLPCASIEVEHLAQPRFFLLVRSVVAVPAMRAVSAAGCRRWTTMIIIVIVVVTTALPRRAAALQNLVEFAAIEPHAPATRAVVDLDAAAIGDLQLGCATRTFHINDPISRSRDQLAAAPRAKTRRTAVLRSATLTTCRSHLRRLTAPDARRGWRVRGNTSPTPQPHTSVQS